MSADCLHCQRTRSNCVPIRRFARRQAAMQSATSQAAHRSSTAPLNDSWQPGGTLQPLGRGAQAGTTATASTSGVGGAPLRPLVVVGSINADLVLQVERLPKSGETISSSSLEWFPGGKGANQAAAAAKLGYPTYMLGQVGTDSNAAQMRAVMQEYGVNLEHVRTVEGSTGTAIILLQPLGENSIVIVGGANQAQWDIDEQAEQLIQGAGAVLLQREIPESVNVKVAQLARSAGVPVVLDVGGAEGPISDELLAHISVLSPNETELERLVGLPTDTEEQIQQAARALLSKGMAGDVLVKLGADGSLLIPASGAGSGPLRQPALPAPAVVDTTGAGDCFTAAFAVASLQGKEHADALRFASAAACLCVQRKGAMTSLPHRQDVEALLQQQHS